jgi:phosphoglycerate dehydrogenase-like enzyme
LTPQTEQLIDAAALAALPTDAIVINVGRGRLIDTEALVAALQANQLHGVALDVTDPEPLPTEHVLWALPQVVITPHVAGHTPRYFDRCAEILLDNIDALPASGVPSGLRNQVV